MMAQPGATAALLRPPFEVADDPARAYFEPTLRQRPAIAIKPQRALRSPENLNATLDTHASPADDARHH
jgi:hypothetical protein